MCLKMGPVSFEATLFAILAANEGETTHSTGVPL